jgi:5-methylcytosine-specific restriction endonuclease McrA
VNTACLTPLCPRFAVPGGRGRCAVHRQTTAQRGYGREHQAERRAALPGARCSACGCTRNLQRDHVVPTTLGGSQAPANKRWLCACAEHGCHGRVGRRSNSRVMA